jgi:hypothetical protein
MPLSHRFLYAMKEKDATDHMATIFLKFIGFDRMPINLTSIYLVEVATLFVATKYKYVSKNIL